MSYIYIPGKKQELVYGATSQRLYYATNVNGRRVKLSSVPTIQIYDNGGTSLLSATNMSAETNFANGAFLDFDAQSAEFSIGATLTGAAGAKGRIVAIYSTGTSGTLQLAGVDGTFVNNEACTDNGANTGAATVDGTLYTGLYYYDWNSSTQDAEENYAAKIVFTDADSRAHVDYFYFDIVFHPYEPLITSSDIDQRHPDWLAARDEYSTDWSNAINQGHSEVARRLRNLGNRPALIVDRTQLYPIELAFIEAEIAMRFSRFTPEEKKFWLDKAEEAWMVKPQFNYRDSEDETPDTEISDEPIVAYARLTR